MGARRHAAVVVLAIVALVLGARGARADPLQDDGVFEVTAGCAPEKDRAGTGFLVSNWPAQGELSLVTALHVVYRCSSLVIKASKCDSKRRSEELTQLSRYTRLRIRVWPRHDLVVFRNIPRTSAWVAGRPTFHWKPLPATSRSRELYSGRDIVVGTPFGKSYCPSNPGHVNSPIGELKDRVQRTGTVDGSTPAILYDIGGPGASGSPVTLSGTADVVAIHEAGFPDQHSENAALVVLPDDLMGSEVDTDFPDWRGVEFEPPPHPQAYAELTETERARVAPTRGLSLSLVNEWGGPMAVGDGFTTRLEGEIDVDFDWNGKAADRAYGILVRPLGLTVTHVAEIERNPAGARFDTQDRLHPGFTAAAGAYARFFRQSWLQVDVDLAPRLDVVWESHEGEVRSATFIPGVVGDARVRVYLSDPWYLVLGLRGGGEYAPVFAYTYSLFPVAATRDGYELRGLFGGQVGVAWSWR